MNRQRGLEGVFKVKYIVYGYKLQTNKTHNKRYVAHNIANMPEEINVFLNG